MIRLITCAALTIACSGNNDTAEPQDCEQRSGVYLLQYEERAGDCGPLDEVLVPIDQNKTLANGCSGSIKNSSDNCRVTANTTCPLPDYGEDAKVHIVAVTDWSTDSFSGRGTMQFDITLPDGQMCHSTYNTTVIEQ